MTWFMIVIVFVAWAVLLATMYVAFSRRDTCPECGSERIELVDLRTTRVEVMGETIPVAWVYRRCRGCGARLKWDIGQDEWGEIEPGEWEEVVEDRASP